MKAKSKFPVWFLMVLAFWLNAGPTQGQGFGVGNYQVLSSTRVGRTEFEYTLSVTISNQVASAVGVSAQVFSVSPNTVVIQGDVNFGDVALGSSVVGQNTITVRQNRLSPFNPADLQWFVTVQSMPLSLTVNSPVSGFLTNGSIVAVNGSFGSSVEGVTIGRSPATIIGTNFSGTFTLEEGRNTISVLASNHYGGSGLINVFVTRDTTPPILNIETPTNGTVLAARQVTISGLVNDAVPGTVNPEQASVMVNGLPALILNRSFSVSDVLLVPGTNTVTAVARDRAGNESQKQIQLVFVDPASQKRLVQLAGDEQFGIVGTLLPQALLVELVDADGVIQTNQPVNFAVTRNDGILLSSPDSGRNLTVQTDDKGQARVLLQLGTRTGVGNNQVVVTSPGVNGQMLFEASGVGALPDTISPLIPETQVGEIGKPLPLPWTAYATDSGGNPVAGAPITFTVSQGGGSLGSGGATTISTNTDSDGRASVILTLGPDEGVNNNAVLAECPGVTNSAVFKASALTPGAINATRVIGLVLDNANHPMSNVLCVIANTTRAAVTDQQGQFIISGTPVGAIRLIVDAQNRGYPGEWHALTFNMVTVAGRDNSLDRPIYMVQVDSDSAAIAGGDQDVVLHLKDFPGATLTVFAHSLRNDRGQPITNRVTWTQVNAERIPMAPPQGSQPNLTTAILPAGMRFNPPAKMCVPNSGLPPGQILEIYGFDHDIGSFVSVGTATVSSDGSTICSDPGFGIVKSGWHFPLPPPPPCTPVCSGPPADTDCIKYETIPPATPCDCPTYKPKETKLIKVDAKVEGTNAWVTCTNVDLHFSVDVTSTNCGGYTYEWDFKDGSPKDTAASPTHKFATTGDRTVEVTVKCSTCTSAQLKGTVEVGVADITFARAGTEDAAGNAYGYEDNDTPEFTDDHVSVKNGDSTYLKVTVAGTTKFDKVFMVSKDEAKVKVDPPTATGASFLLKVTGQANKGETQIEAHGGKKDGPKCASIFANSYKEIPVSGKIVRVFQTGKEATTIGPDVVLADAENEGNSNLKYPVVKLTFSSKSKKAVDFDKNGNGKMDYYNDGTNPEYDQILNDLKADGIDYTDSVIMKDGFPDIWRIAGNVVAGTNKITLTGGAGGLDTSETFSLELPDGTGAETFQITGVAGQVLTIDTDPGTAGNQGFANAHPKGADDKTSHAVRSTDHLVVGLSSNIATHKPALLVGQSSSAVGMLASHEQMHGQGLSDVNLLGNVMNYTVKPVDKKRPFRYKALVQVITGTPNPKPGSPTDQQWEIPAR